MKVVVMSRGLSADRVIAIRNGFLSRYREYPNGCIEVAVVVSICEGAEDGLIDVASKAFKDFDRVWEELMKSGHSS